MKYKQLYEHIKNAGNFLCVGLDSDSEKIPLCLKDKKDSIYRFNVAIADAVAPYCVAYKINTAFYEACGSDGIREMELTAGYIKEKYPDHLLIADAKRGDIGNTAKQYARAFFKEMNFDAVTLSPYMGRDAVAPFLEYDGKWAVILALTSNKSAEDFETAKLSGLSELSGREMPLYEKVIREAMTWGSKENIMFVAGATRPEMLSEIRKITPDNFLLVPGIGAQGGTVADVATHAMNGSCGVLANSSRGIIFADGTGKFAETAAEKARELAEQMAPFVSRI